MTESNHWLRVGVGELDPFFETGTEGVIWSLAVSGVPGYEGLLPLVNGDWVRVFDAQGGVLWEGEVDLEFDRRHRPYPMNPSCGQQEVGGFWVHGLQSSLDPDAWADMFFKHRSAVVWRRATSVSQGPGRLFENSWQFGVMRLGLSERPPHEQALRLWDAVCTEGSPYATLCQRVSDSMLYILRYNVKDKLGWSLNSLTNLLELDEQDTQIILATDTATTIKGALSKEGTRRGLAFLNLLGYFRFPGGDVPDWAEASDVRALRHAHWRDVLLLLEIWAPSPARLRVPQD